MVYYRQAGLCSAATVSTTMIITETPAETQMNILSLFEREIHSLPTNLSFKTNALQRLRHQYFYRNYTLRRIKCPVSDRWAVGAYIRNQFNKLIDDGCLVYVPRRPVEITITGLRRLHNGVPVQKKYITLREGYPDNVINC